jgi:hypothetical protein
VNVPTSVEELQQRAAEAGLNTGPHVYFQEMEQV